MIDQSATQEGRLCGYPGEVVRFLGLFSLLTWAQAWLLLVVPEPTSCAVKLYRLRITEGVTPRCRPTVPATCGSGRCLRDDIGGKRCSPPTVEGVRLEKDVSIGFNTHFTFVPSYAHTAPKLVHLLYLPSPSSTNPTGLTKVHMRSQGLRELVGMWGPYNTRRCRASHIVMELSPRE